MSSSSFDSLTNIGWNLVAVEGVQSVSNITTLVESKSKTLKYILLFRDSSWLVYAPTNNSNVDSTLTRLTEVKANESFWVYVE